MKDDRTLPAQQMIQTNHPVMGARQRMTGTQPKGARPASNPCRGRHHHVAPCVPFWMSASPEGLPGEDDVDVPRTPPPSFFLWFNNPFTRVVAGAHPLWGEPPMV